MLIARVHLFAFLLIIHKIFLCLLIQVKGFGGATYKSFKTYQEADSFVRAHYSSASFTTSQSNRPAAAPTNGKAENTKKRAADTNQNNPNKRPCTNNSSYNQITIHFDGGSRGNPGVAGAGSQVVFTTSTSKTTFLIREYCGDKQTNNYAEYTGMIAGLKQAKSCVVNHVKNMDPSESIPDFTIDVYGDSNLAIQQMNGCWQCKNENIKPLYNQARELAYTLTNGDVGAKCLLKFQHVYREQNKVADGKNGNLVFV